MAKESTRPLNVVIVGHEGTGKSSIAGCLLRLTGGVNKDTVSSVKKAAFDSGKPEMADAWLLDKDPTSRNAGHSVVSECCRIPGCNPTSDHEYRVTVIPGKARYVRKALTAISIADRIIVVVDARKLFFSLGMSTIGGQTREHLMQSFMSQNIHEVIVAVNYMDQVKWKREEFYQRVQDIAKYLKKLGASTIICVPVSAIDGSNINDTHNSSCMSWYSGWKSVELNNGSTRSGKSLVDAIYAMSSPARIGDLNEFIMPVEHVYKIGGIGTVVGGHITSGTVDVGKKICIAPNNIHAEVKSIGCFDRHDIKSATTSDYVGLLLPGVSQSSVTVGSLVLDVGTKMIVVKEFEAQVFLSDCNYVLEKDSCLAVMMTCDLFDCRIISIMKGKDAEIAKSLTKFERAILRLRPLKPFYFLWNAISNLNNIILRRNNVLIGLGRIKKVDSLYLQYGP